MASAAKKLKTSEESGSNEFKHFLHSVEKNRKEAAGSIADFKFNKKRVRVLSKKEEIADGKKCILYWMNRDQRVQDNWALLYAQKLALKFKLPLRVCFCTLPKYMDATIRHSMFMLRGLEEVNTELEKLKIPFHLLYCNNKEEVAQNVLNLVDDHDAGCVVVDFSPLRIARAWLDDLKEILPKDVPLCQVDAHNIVPCWHASDKLEYGARTIRNKINSKLGEFLTQFPPLIQHPHPADTTAKSINWEDEAKKFEVDRTVGEISWARPGYQEGMKTLHEFCEKRLKKFGTKRNNPLENALSNLSPWYHFGQISIQRCILHVITFKNKYKESVDAFCEESIVRRELADNFCFYNANYDKIDGAYDWAKKTLNDHKKDKRTHVYSCKELEDSKTHDDLWNSAQIQLVKEGKMHGFLRMYWAKKILEWTPSPEEALRIALYLNDRFSIDGRDPNGFVGCMWSICGIHDQGWREREVFGKIRFMNYDGCKRKFDVAAFVARYGGKVYKASRT
uniref:Deoxyribodipyrimidine photo-lyase n=3 Tax=Lygus hesperus TaxID=30085 RepID=A0A0A9WTY5_LYGHE